MKIGSKLTKSICNAQSPNDTKSVHPNRLNVMLDRSSPKPHFYLFSSNISCKQRCKRPSIPEHSIAGALGNPSRLPNLVLANGINLLRFQLIKNTIISEYQRYRFNVPCPPWQFMPGQISAYINCGACSTNRY